MCAKPLSPKIGAFLIQPFDDVQEDRTAAVQEALEKFSESHDFAMLSPGKARQSNWLSQEVFSKIDSASLVVVDTVRAEAQPVEPWGRPNVYAELGYALAQRKPIILIQKRDEARHSDFAGAFVLDVTSSAWQERRAELVKKLPEELREVVDWAASMAWRGSLDKVMRLLRAHIRFLTLDPTARSLPSKLEGSIVVDGGLPVAVLRIADVPGDAILRVLVDTGAVKPTVGLASNWVQAAPDVFVGAMLVASPKRIFQAPLQMREDGDSKVPFVAAEFQVWKGELNDDWTSGQNP